MIPNFIGELPAPPPATTRAWRQLPDEPFILYFGDVTEDKGAWHLVEAYAGLEDPPPLVLIGRCYIDELAERPGVHALGAAAARAGDRGAAALAVHASRPRCWPEPFGLVALEAAAAGKPVVASDIGGLRDIVVDGETGFLVAAGRPRGAARALRRLLRRRRAAGADGGGGAARARRSSAPRRSCPSSRSAYELAGLG